ncbi:MULTISPECIES: EamA family transporter [unclassified Clostridium]|uniref:EamA family transporter n=1 Tax=unclassified Clostridium TaxID=2614128 RepID=UPI001243203D
MDKSSNKIKGIFYIAIASIAFGIMPILAKLAYKGGANAINTLALRFTFASIILFIYIKTKKLSLRVSKEQIKLILFMGVIGYSMTSILLFTSYNYIDVGIAGMILHTYPLMVMILSIIIYKEKFKLKKFLYLMVTTIGVFIMLDIKVGSINTIGVVLVLLSALCYAIYVLGASNDKVKNIDSYVMTFYISIISAIVGSTTGIVTNSFNNPINFYGIISILLIAFISTVVALMAFLKGVKLIGPTNSAIFSALEPIVSLVLGVIILGESMSFKIIIGSTIIILAMIELAKDTIRN